MEEDGGGWRGNVSFDIILLKRGEQGGEGE
jgi:hypothetical protein